MNVFPKLDPLDRRLVPLNEGGEQLTDALYKAGIQVAFTELRSKPDNSAPIDTQLIFGEPVRVFAEDGAWSLVQAERDRYVGWLETSTLSPWKSQPTHRVIAPRTFFYPEPDLKLPHKGMRSMGSTFRIVEEVDNRGTRYALLETGEAVISRHVARINDHQDDYVAVAETLLRTPYLWAGTSGFGIDCSGLVKLAMFMCGSSVLRDTDMQAATIGDPIDPGADFQNVQRGDLIFWKGHVAICQGPDVSGRQMLVHANGHTMDVSSEPLKEAVERIAYLYVDPIGVRRPNNQAE